MGINFSSSGENNLKNNEVKMQRITLLIITFLFLGWGVVPAQQRYATDEQINISVYEKISPAIVAIDAQVPDGVSAGTGCIVTPDGLILTGSHVVEDASQIDVTTHNGQTYRAKFVANMGKNKDLALIKIEAKRPLQVVSFRRFGRSESRSKSIIYRKSFSGFLIL